MKATIDFDDALYRRLKLEAVRRGRTVRELVAEGVRLVLDGPAVEYGRASTPATTSDRPSWYGMLREQAQGPTQHDLASVRESIARGRSRPK